MLLLSCEQFLRNSSSLRQHTSLTFSCFLYHHILFCDHLWSLLTEGWEVSSTGCFVTDYTRLLSATAPFHMPWETHCVLCPILLFVLCLQKLQYQDCLGMLCTMAYITSLVLTFIHLRLPPRLDSIANSSCNTQSETEQSKHFSMNPFPAPQSWMTVTRYYM